MEISTKNKSSEVQPLSPLDKDHCSIVVLGASGDLAFKKTYPALFSLYKNQLLPKNVHIVGYARSPYSALQEFHKRISQKFKISNPQEQKLLNEFLQICSYVSGQYDAKDSFIHLDKCIKDLEIGFTGTKDRLFYMALPPSVFIPASTNLREHVYSSFGQNRLIVEKPFGKDTDSSKELSDALALKWMEKEIYRIDHYLGKEMVKNIMILRFANVFFSSVWNAQSIQNIQITFKEKIGTEGRGGYFDEFGIIRDVIQNHLLQILTLIAMEKPASLDADDVRDEKVKVLKTMKPVTMDHALLGQYVKSLDGKEPGYLDDPTVPKGSLTPTFAAMVLYVDNERWCGVPFIIKAGKALNEAKVEIRIQFKNVPGDIYATAARNELVIRIQPEEAIYLKFMNKKPGLQTEPVISELDLSYSSRFHELKIHDAYESLILDALKGDKSHFVRDDELDAAWKIFTPLLKQLEDTMQKPCPYPMGSRGPDGLNEFIQQFGYVRQPDYHWSKM